MTLSNPNAPATRKQLWALYCITKTDYREQGLTMQETSDLIESKGKKITGKVLRKKVAKRNDEEVFEQMMQEANEAGMRAAKGAVCEPMIVQQHANMANDNSPVVKEWHVEGGVCGFGWVEVRPTQSKFGKWLRKTERGLYSNYSHCVMIWSPGPLGQSMTRNGAWAHAAARVLAMYNINARGCERID